MNNYDAYSAILNQCDKELDEIYHKYALKNHISDAALWILYAIYEAKEQITQADICSSWYFSRQTINTALKGLEQQGMIELVSMPSNRKSKQIKFTIEGNKDVEKILMPLIKAENHIFEEFSEEENKMFLELSQKRCRILRELLEEKQ